MIQLRIAAIFLFSIAVDLLFLLKQPLQACVKAIFTHVIPLLKDVAGHLANHS